LETEQVSEGEFKKRIKKESFKPFMWEGKAEAVWDFDLEKWIDEAKRDYPSLISLGLVPKLSEYDIDKIDKARQDWFVKWFGK
jgi:hypothetical protein